MTSKELSTILEKSIALSEKENIDANAILDMLKQELGQVFTPSKLEKS
ncbi:hypothetical protein [Falsibacillus albus]|nr:hypothetical protein [Falsibacillus albus]